MIKLTIDGKNYDVKPGKNLLEVSLSLGIDIPHFCFHAALGSVGACRLCAVKKFRDKDDTRGRIVMSCMEPVTEGLIVSVEDKEVKEFRASILESLMTNHPHDCPVCDEGGECHLQDMTVMTGHNYRKFDFPKRTYKNQDLGPFLNHEMNRCIQCYRCVRFYRDYAGGKDLNAFSSRNHVYFGRHEDGTLENEFSGNLVEVCPTGVFTDKTLKSHFTRKWDLTNAPSVCNHCSVGCNTIVSERYGSVRRIMDRYNGSVNGYFICDRGRFGYEFVNSDKRIRKISVKSEDKKAQVDRAGLLKILDDSDSGAKNIVGIGSPRASVEANFALFSLVGENRFYHGISMKEHMLTAKIVNYFSGSGVSVASLKQIEKADAVLILGEDLVNTAPMMALAVRQASRKVPMEEATGKGIPLWNDSPVREIAQDRRSPIYLLTPFSDSLDEISAGSFRGKPADIAGFGDRIASILKGSEVSTGNQEDKELSSRVAVALRNAKNPVIISGVSLQDESIINAAFNIVTALKNSGSKVMVSMVVPESDSMGLALFPGLSFEELLKNKNNEIIDTIIILENDLFRRTGSSEVDDILKRCGRVIVIDSLDNKTTGSADIVLPASTFAESEGTLVSNEGRAQRYYKAMDPAGDVQESWRWITDLSSYVGEGTRITWKHTDDILDSAASVIPLLAKMKNYNPGADYRMLNAKVPRQTMRYSGRTAINAAVSVSEPAPEADEDSPMVFSMEGIGEKPPSSLTPFYWSPGWNSVQAMYSYLDEPNGSMKGGDPGIRLFESFDNKSIKYFNQTADRMDIPEGEWLFLPVHQIFGSEELSAQGKAVSLRITGPFILLNRNDADLINVKENDTVEFNLQNEKLLLKVRIDDNLLHGVSGLSVGMPGMPFISFPATGKFTKVK